jgi:ATP-dependent DNA ligase
MPGNLHPPDVALAKAVEVIPASGALPGGSIYEPKWDGFRALIIRASDGDTTIWSKQSKDLTRYFPDLVAAAVAQIPAGVTLDGEALCWTDDRLDFENLQRRLTTSSRALPQLIREHPASYAAFDVLAVAGQDARALPLRHRRILLEELAAGWVPPLNLSPITRDRDQALEWFTGLASAGIEGLVVKGEDQPYEGGKRQWRKVKHRDTLDVVCAAVLGSVSRPAALVVGLPQGGRLRIVGASTQLTAAKSRALAGVLRPAGAGHPWPTEVPRGYLERFAEDRELVKLTLVEPFVVEVSADVAWSGWAFRHSVRFVRLRPEMSPGEVELPERLR